MAAREYAVAGNPNLSVHETFVQLEAPLMGTLSRLTPLSDLEFEALTTRIRNLKVYQGIIDRSKPENRLNETDIQEICRFLIRNEIKGSLIRLNLGQNNIGDMSAKLLAASIITQSTLVQLHLYRNEIGGEGAEALSTALENLPLLKDIALDQNQLGEVGATAVAKALWRLTSLHSLNLAKNQIGGKGASALSTAIEKL
jgi:hypothetical protein